MALKRITALLLAIVMTIGIFPVYTSAEEGDSAEVTVLYNGNPQTEVVLPQGDYIHLDADLPEGQTGAYQWQIRVADDFWVDIKDATESTLRVSYGMVASLLKNSAAQLRCTVTFADGAVVSSTPVTLTMSYEDRNAAVAIPEIQDAADIPAVIYETVKEDNSAKEPVQDSAEDSAEESAAAEAAAAAEAFAAAQAAADAAAAEYAAAAAAVETARAAKEAADRKAAEAAAAETTPAEESADSTEPTESSVETEETQPAVTAAQAAAEAEAAAQALATAEEIAAAKAAAAEEAAAALETARAAKADADAKAAKAAARSAAEPAAAPAAVFAAAPAAEEPSAGDTPERYTIQINYLHTDGSIAASPWVGTISSSQAFTQMVTPPVVAGYDPTWSGTVPGVTAATDGGVLTGLTLNFAAGDLRGDLTINVTYQPALVEYTVIHYLQNIDNDNYTIDKRETKTAYTGTQITDEVSEDYVADTDGDGEADDRGFYALDYEKPQVAADGSTIIEVYYDRYYYLLSFEMNGGYGIYPVYARYQSPIVDVGTPTRPGYTFGRWEDKNGNEADIPATMPAYDLPLTAVWTNPNSVNYTVVYWKENADDNGYSYWDQETRRATAGSVISGSDDIDTDDEQYFTYNEALTDKDVVIEGDGSTVINVYYTRNYYTIFFYGYGTCALEDHTHSRDCQILVCGSEEHTHGDDCEETLVCSLDEHTHSDDCCTLDTAHTHTTNCYDNVNINGNVEWQDTWGAPNNPVDGQIYRRGNGYNRIIYINGTWYRYNRNNVNSGTVVQPNNNCPGNHTHGDGSCTCDETAHTHDADACYTYSCGKVSHTHTDACYRDCYLIEHTHSSDCNRNDSDNVIYVINAKYEQNIDALWPTYDVLKEGDHAYEDNSGNVENNNNQRFRGWDIDGVSNEAVSKRVTMTADLCDTSDGLKNATAQYDTDYYVHLYYMFESFDQTSPENGNNRKRYNGKYYDISTVYSQDVYANNSEFGQKEITGMTAVGTQSNRVGGSNSTEYNNFLYYDRNRVDLMFQNIDTIVKTETNIMFEQPLANYKDSSGNLLSAFVPEYPDTLEPGVYVFGGWYTTPECYEGTEFDFATETMPNNDLTLYANWTPIKHTVEFYLTRADMEAENKLGETHPDIEIAHGTKIDRANEPDNGSYTFTGWFYLDNGVEKAFDIEEMPVNEDMKLYAKWSSKELRPYTVRYVVEQKDEDGNIVYTDIADPTTGSALAGNTRTFEAKGGTDLYEDYQSGYFPRVQSHSMTIDINDETGTTTNQFLFVYEPREAVPYTVRYLIEDENGNRRPALIATEDGYRVATDTDDANSPEYRKVVSDNIQAVVTENFVVIPGYMPDAYQHRLVVSVEEGADNTITFVYTKNEVEAFYKITHYIKNLEGDGWTEYTSSEIVGTIGQVYSANSMSIDGFVYSYDDTVTENAEGITVTNNSVSGTLPAAGMELNLYYTRILYPYEVRYVEATTGETLIAPKTGYAPYGTYIAEQYMPIGSPELYEPDAESKSMTINVEDTVWDDTTAEVPEGTAQINVITFYYTRHSGNLKISKDVQDNTNGNAPDAVFDFTVTLTRQIFPATSYAYVKYQGSDQIEEGYLSVTMGGMLTFQLKDGQSILIKGLPTGPYTVAEAAVDDFMSSAPYGVSVELTRSHTETAPAVAAYTNTYPVKTGGLYLYKEVEYDYEKDSIPAGELFEFQVKFDNTDAANQPFTYTVGEAEKTAYADASGLLTIQLAAGETAHFAEAPVGKYTVTEAKATVSDLEKDYSSVEAIAKNADGDQILTGEKSVSSDIIAGYDVSAAFVNTYARHKGNLTINKTVNAEYTGDAWDEADWSDTFTFWVTSTALTNGESYLCYNGTAEGETITVADGKLEVELPVSALGDYSVNIQDLPTGDYTVTEVEDSEYIINNGASNALTVTIEPKDEASTVSFTNLLKRPTGYLQISKTIQIVEGSGETLDDAKKAQLFEFTVKLNDDGSIAGKQFYHTISNTKDTEDTSDDTVVTERSLITANAQNELVINLKHNEYVLIEELPIGKYTVTETYVYGYNSSFGELEGSKNTLDPVTITRDNTEDNPATASCINGFPFYYGDLVIEKEVTAASELDMAPDDTFTFTVAVEAEEITEGRTYDAYLYESADDTDPTKTSVTISAVNGVKQFTVRMKAGQRILIDELNVCDYTITESADGLSTHYDTYYTIDKAEGEDDASQASTTPVAGTTATGTLGSGDTDTVTFTNEYKVHLAELTITKDRGTAANETQSFLFQVSSTDLTYSDAAVSVPVVITIPEGQTSASVTLTDMPAGIYQIVEEETWSWRYGDAGTSTVELDEAAETVTINNTRTNPYWLSGSAVNQNIFDGNN